MTHRFFTLIGGILLALAAVQAGAQSVYRERPFPVNENRVKNSANYWGSRKPDAAYWQQDVQYNIYARVNEETHVIEGSEDLDYWNNSPDTLTYVYFHLYQNAFVKGSYLHDLEKAQKVKPRLGKYEAAGLGTVVENLKVSRLGDAGADDKDSLGRVFPGIEKAELDNTILKITLAQPLYPGDGIRISMNFKTYYDRGGTRRRMQMYPAWGFMHYNGCQWYPKIAVYDRKFGWDTYQHLNKEFYGDFGIFDVTLDFPSNYIVEATGKLINREEVLPADLREKLDLKNFANKKWNEPPSTIIPYEKGKRKQWRFHAEDVHDFAFTADPSYRMATTTWNGIECVAIAQEPHAAGWQNAADYVAKIIRTFSEDIGMYRYPKMVAADANDGMEYPMLTLDGGSDPGYRGLLVHEIAHNWFYGMVGSNETYRAALDEGFTQFLTSWGLKRIDGDTLVQSPPRSRYRRLFYEPASVDGQRVYNAYVFDALNQEELPLNTHSNDFHNALGHEGGYRQVYYKTATMLYNLQYTLGDSLFQAAMKHYFEQWKFAHPYFEDFRNSIIQFTHADLNWFFDQWLETTKTIDYGICGIRKVPGEDSFSIRLRRSGSMQMPVDFTVTAKDGSKHNFHVPNTWFTKSTPATVLPKWYGWGALHQSYDARVQVPGGIRSVEIDTTGRLADRYALDNYRHRGPGLSKAIRWRLDGGVAPTSMDRRRYNLFVRPDLWWNEVDGIKAGVHVEGNYLNTMHKLDATVWFNTHVLQGDDYLSFKSQGYYEKYIPVNYTFNYISPLSRNLPKLQVQINSRILDGLNYHRAGFNWLLDEQNTLQFYAQTMWRALSYDLDYLLYPQEWSSARARPNSSLNFSWSRRVSYVHGAGLYTVSARAPFMAGKGSNAFNYSWAQLEAINYNRIGKLEVRTRLFGRYGTGSVIPQESALWLSGANPEELMDNKYTRSVGIVPNDWKGISRYETNHFQQGGGLNLRGYAGYFVADERDGEVLIGYKGRSGFSGNIEVDVDNYIPLRPRFTRNWLHADLYAFADAGMIELSRYSTLAEYWKATPANKLSDLRLDAGVGIALTIKKWGVFDKAQPLTLRFDVPFVVNRPPYADPQYTDFRYVIGINRSF